ncbi:hypothetical protein E4T56_gene11171 [Termitomyces sp. T112]|nr:hypothetical protein E4T56_gene11171 [Termitomyces sp. T112]
MCLGPLPLPTPPPKANTTNKPLPKAPSKRTQCSHTQPGPKHNPFSNRWRSGSNTYEGSPHALKWPCWPANPPSTLLPPTLPIADQPPVPFPTPLPPLWATPPAASDAPTSSAPAPPTPRCSMPAPMPPSLPVLHLDPPLPVKALHFLQSATKDALSLCPLHRGPTCPTDCPELASPDIQVLHTSPS